MGLVAVADAELNCSVALGFPRNSCEDVWKMLWFLVAEQTGSRPSKECARPTEDISAQMPGTATYSSISG